jgi:hypothetical protein
LLWKNNKKNGSGKHTSEAVDAVEEITENEAKTSLRPLSQEMSLSVQTCHISAYSQWT